MSEIQIAVNAKIPSTVGTVKPIVANNSDYVVRFAFDDEWDDGAKTVIYVREDGYAYAPVRMVGDVAPIPRQQNGGVDKRLYIGVVQGDLRTSRAIGIPVVSSVADIINDDAVVSDPDMWEGMLQRIMHLEDNPAVFWAEYGVTPLDDVLTAMREHKACAVNHKVGISVICYATAYQDFNAAPEINKVSFVGIYQNGPWIYKRELMVDTSGWSYNEIELYKEYDDGGGPGIVNVEYGVTKYADIITALTQGKVCVLIKGTPPDAEYRVARIAQDYSDGGLVEFTSIDQYGFDVLLRSTRVTKDDKWSDSERIVFNKYNLTKTVDDKGTNEQAPSVKAVYDALPKKAEDVGALAKSELGTAIETALAKAKESGEFDGAPGKDGTSVTVSEVVESTEDGGENTVKFSDGKILRILNGKRGQQGAKGDPGDDYVLTDADKQEIANMIPAGGGSTPGTGGAAIDVTAQVGQTIIVKEIDENGKPTKWESADYQPRTHWKTEERKAVLESTELPYVEDMGGFVLMDPIDVVAGNTYIVNWNGAEYTCPAVEISEDGVTSVALGDLYTFSDGALGTAPTGEPFIIVLVPDELIEETGNAVQILSFEGLESVTLSIIGDGIEYHHLDPRYIKDMYRSETGVILPETTAEVIPDFYGLAKFMPNYPLLPGGKYTVVINGKTYTRTAQSQTRNGVEAIWLGNGAMLGLEETGDPFSIFYTFLIPDEDGNPVYAIYATYSDDGETAATTVTLYIEGETKVHKIPKMYIPDISNVVYFDGIIASTSLTDESVDFGMVPEERIIRAIDSGKDVVLRITPRTASGATEYFRLKYNYDYTMGYQFYHMDIYIKSVIDVTITHKMIVWDDVTSTFVYKYGRDPSSILANRITELEEKVAALENGTT